MSVGSPMEIMWIVLCRDISWVRNGEWNITTQNNEHDLHRGSPTHLFVFLCRTIDVISSSGIVLVLRDLHRRSRYGGHIQNKPYYGIKLLEFTFLYSRWNYQRLEICLQHCRHRSSMNLVFLLSAQTCPDIPVACTLSSQWTFLSILNCSHYNFE